ncbi:hypothetical protein I3760_13G119500 [Carya illinoinensis]|nr:hypothetical protein I3760_13G119500 [Carya illinoinensis]
MTGFSEGSLPFKYLGMPIVVDRLKASNFGELLGKVKNKIAGWKMKLLSASEFEGKGKRKLVAWNKICRPTEESGLGIRDFGDIQWALHMKLAWHMISGHSLWAEFFRNKSVRGNHLYILAPNKGTRFWRSIVKSIPDVLNNSKWRVREGNLSFWYDNWEECGPLNAQFSIIEQPFIKIKELYIDNG